MALGDVYRSAVSGTIADQEWVNTLYFKQLSAGGDLGGLNDAILSTIYDAMITHEASTWKVLEVTTSQLKVGGGEQLITSSAIVGTSSSNSPGDTTKTAVASFRTSLIGRSHRGRNYFPMLNSGNVVSGQLVSGYKTPLLAAYNAFLAIYGVGGTDTDYAWVVWSRKLGETLDSGGHVTAYDFTTGAFPVNLVKVDSVARVIRRREVGVGA